MRSSEEGIVQITPAIRRTRRILLVLLAAIAAAVFFKPFVSQGTVVTEGVTAILQDKKCVLSRGIRTQRRPRLIRGIRWRLVAHRDILLKRKAQSQPGRCRLRAQLGDKCRLSTDPKHTRMLS